MAKPEIRVLSDARGSFRVRILVAKDYGSRLRGLMFRKTWPDDWQGLYFPHCAVVHTSWTGLRPDLVFLDKEDRVMATVSSAKPWWFFAGPRGTRNTLELPMGTLQIHPLGPGDRLV